MKLSVQTFLFSCVVAGSATVILIRFVLGGHALAASVPSMRAFPTDLSSSSRIPFDVDETFVSQLVEDIHPKDDKFTPEQTQRLLVAQREFDILAWQAFLALNWPQKGYNNPQPEITSTDGEPLWMYWRPSQTIFLPNGEDPGPWTAEQQLEKAEGPQFALLKSKAAWRQEASPQDNFQAFSGPLVDQNGKWVRYEALVDEEEFNYIRDNKLYSLDGQIAFSQKDQENDVSMPLNEGTSRHGAIEIKLAWKEMGPNDNKDRFFTKQVRVKISGPGDKPQFRQVTAGLVGMHIAMRTQSSPEWIWATFEQIDNTRQNPGGHPNFVNLHEPPGTPVNVLPAKNGGCTPPGSKTGCTTWYENLTTTPIQVKRIEVPTQPGLNPVDAEVGHEVAELNQQVQALLQQNNSVFRYYELIGTQWPVQKNAPAFAGGQGSAPESITHKTPGNMLPVFLVNTTMETYFQKGLQKAGPLEQDDRLTDNSLIDSTMVVGTESCVGCHYSAGICIGYKRKVDGTPELAPNGTRIPVFGENGHFGKSAHGNFSWMLQIEASSPNLAPPRTPQSKSRRKVNPNVQP